MISFNCPTCAARMQVPPEAAGRPARCPSCKTISTTPDLRIVDPPQPLPPAPAALPGLMRFGCECGKRLKAPVEAAGQMATCPKCDRQVVVPRAGAELAILEDEPDDGPEETGLDPVLYRRQVLRERKRTRRLVAAGVVAVAGIAAVAVLVATRKRPEPPAVVQADPRPRPVQPVDVAPIARPPEAPRREQPVLPPREPVPVVKPAPGALVDPTPPEPKQTTPAQPLPARPPTPPTSTPEASSVPRPPFKSDRPAKESFPGYFTRTVDGFKMHVSRLSYEQSDEAEGEPLKVLDDEIARLAEIFNDRALRVLRSVPIWVEWDHTIPESVRAFAAYYGTGGEGLLTDGVDPRKAGCICVLSLKTAHRLRTEKGARQNTLLHEFAHVVHDKVYGRDNAFVLNAFRQATARRLYAKVLHDTGGIGPAYAARNQFEYFAELSCAYLDRLDYAPHDRAELREHDSVGYEIMTKAWGTPEEIERARTKARGKKK